MGEDHGWQVFFDGHAPEYMKNVFTKNTVPEVDFMVNQLRLEPGARVLDMGCGTGRHSIELARRNFRVTGVDISAGMLAEAKKTATQVGVEVNWVQADATRVELDSKFDAAICVCEGAFGLIARPEEASTHDPAILNSIARCLLPTSPLLLTVPNGLAKIRQYSHEDVNTGLFDPMTLVEVCSMEYDTPDGKKSVTTYEKGYAPGELKLLVERAGFEVIHIGGGTAGDWRIRPVKLDEIELMVIARKN